MTDAVELSAIATGTGGFIIIGELTNDEYSHSISNAGDVNGDGIKSSKPSPLTSPALEIEKLL
jgi:hypothetical protein